MATTPDLSTAFRHARALERIAHQLISRGPARGVIFTRDLVLHRAFRAATISTELREALTPFRAAAPRRPRRVIDLATWRRRYRPKRNEGRRKPSTAGTSSAVRLMESLKASLAERAR
jgi:hypothetical protein